MVTYVELFFGRIEETKKTFRHEMTFSKNSGLVFGLGKDFISKSALVIIMCPNDELSWFCLLKDSEVNKYETAPNFIQLTSDCLLI